MAATKKQTAVDHSSRNGQHYRIFEFWSGQIRQNIHMIVKTSQQSMANEQKLCKQSSLNYSKKRLSRVSSFAKDEDMARILQEIENPNKYNPSSKCAKKRDSVVDSGGIPPDEELKQLFVDVEKRNAEFEELLQAVESSRDEGQESRISSDGTRGSTDSLVEKLMREFDDVECEEDELNCTLKQSNCSKKTQDCFKLGSSASQEELDQMLADLLEL